MIRKITLLSLLTAIFAFGTVTACKKKKKHKHHKKWKKKHKKWKKHSKSTGKKCKKLYKKIVKGTAYSKKDIKARFGSKDGFISACKVQRDEGPFKKLLKCVKREEELSSCGKKHLATLLGPKMAKVKVPGGTKPTTGITEDPKDNAFKDIKLLGQKLYKKILKKDLEAVKKMVVTKEDVKAFDKGTLFDKYANPKKFEEKFKEWTKSFEGTTFKEVKAKEEEKKTVKPGEKVKKLEELTAAIKAPVTVWGVNVRGEKGGKTHQCAFVAVELNGKWKLLRLKGCKVK